MKKIQLILVFLLIIFPLINSTAQEQENTGQFSYGIHLGSSSSGFTHNRETFSLLKSGFSGGLFAEYKPVSFLGISLEADYVMEGAFHIDPALIYSQSSIYYSGGSVYRSSSDVTLHNIHFPLLINIRPIKSGVSPTISLGYSVDYFLTAVSQDMIMAVGTTGPIPLSKRSSENVSSSFQKWNMGPVAGIGINFPGNKFNISFDVRYKVGLRNINNLAGLNNINGQYDFSVNTLFFYLTISK